MAIAARWSAGENGMIVLEDRNQRRRTFPVGEYGYLVEGVP